jgi:parvulin-like peptidyl-prolyl isomerase
MEMNYLAVSRYGFLLSVAGLIAGAAYADSPVVMRHGDTVITVDEVRFAVQKVVPPSQHGAFYASEKKVRDFIAKLFVSRKLAEAARKRTLTAEEQLALSEANNQALSQLEIAHIYERAPKPNFEALARETYVAMPERFMRAEQVRVEHILVSTKSRSDEEARKLADTLLTEARSGGKPFTDLAVAHSDDPSAKSNKGDLGFFTRGKMVKPFEDAAFAMSKTGEIVGPIRTDFGYHILRLVDKRAEEKIPFDEVREQLVKEGTSKHRSQVIDEELARIGKLQGIETNQQVIETLVVKPDYEKIKALEAPKAK